MVQYVLPARQLNFLAYVFCQKMLDRAKNLKKVDVIVGNINQDLTKITMREAIRTCRKIESLWRTFQSFIKKIKLDAMIKNDKQAKARIVEMADQLPHHAVYALTFLGPVKTRNALDAISFSTSLFIESKHEEQKSTLTTFLKKIEVGRPEVGSKCDQDFRLMSTWSPFSSGVSLFNHFTFSSTVGGEL